MRKKQKVQIIEEISEKTEEFIPQTAEECYLNFGPRRVAPVHDSVILYDRFKFKYGACKYRNCNTLNDKASGKTVGVIPLIPLDRVWDKAQRYKGKRQPAIGKRDWEEDKSRISNTLKKSAANIFIQDVFTIKELDFEKLMLARGSQVIELIKAAVLYDIQESEEIIAKWNKIKKYPHKVALEVSNGGIFSKEDADILRSSGIYYLNDIRKNNIYDLKNLLLQHELVNLPEEINAAFKEDRERRRDKAFKVVPFIFAFIALIVTTTVGFIFQYTLIKNTEMTFLNVIAVCLWLSCLISVIYGAARAVRRRKKRPEYRYFTKRVSTVFSFFVLFSAFSLSSLTVFYTRYDDYNDQFYFRNVSKSEIAVAGLFDKDLNDLSIPKAYNNKEIVGISNNAFRGRDIQSVNVPDTVTSIGKNAFKNCKQLEGIKLPAQLESIENSTFENCYSLRVVNVPESLTVVGPKAFFNAGITEIVLPKNVEHIGESAFNNCAELVNVKINSFSIEIGKNAFKDCLNCKTIEFAHKNGLTRVDEGAFENCSLLKEADFLKGVLYIGKNAFKNCSSLTRLTFNSGVEEFGKDALSECTSLQSLSIPYFGKNINSQESYKYLFDSNIKLVTVEITGTNVIPESAFIGLEELRTVYLPDSVTEIGKNAFFGCKSLIEFSIPSGVTEIRDSTFENCYSLISVNESANIETLGNSAFKNCSSLLSIGFENVKRIGDYCFEGCSRASEIIEMPKLVDIGKSSFKDCNSIKNFKLPAGIEKIPENAFASMYIDTLVLDSAVTTIDRYAFKDSEINNIVLGASIEEIGDYAFASSRIKKITFPDNLKSIGDYAFANCIYLNSIDLPKGLKSIGNNAFEGCSALEQFDLSGITLNAVGKNIFKDCISLKKIILPNTLNSVPEGFAVGCHSLVSINLSAVKSIGKDAFSGCAMQSLVIPHGVTEIMDGAFSSCEYLTSAEIPNSVQTLGSSVFNECVQLKTVKTPFLGKTRTQPEKGYTYLFGKSVEVTGIEITDSETVYKNTFAGGENTVRSISLGTGIKKIENSAFSDFKVLKDINLPSTLTHIGDKAFMGSAMFRVVVPDSVTYLGSSAFNDCNNLTEVVLSKGITEIKSSTFENCIVLAQITIPDKVQTIGQKAFNACLSLSTVKLGSGLKDISNRAFSNCSNLKSINFNNGLEKIGWGAFMFCTSLGTPKIPSSVSVGWLAFAGCDITD